MKNLVKRAAWVALPCSVILAGCAKEQSSMNIDDIKTFSTIIGKVSYSGGQAFKDGRFIELTENATGKTVFVEVPYSAYKQGASGSKVFTTTINNEGTYEISIPLVSNASVAVYAEPFLESYQEFDKMNGEVPQFKPVQCLFSTNHTTVAASPNKKHLQNFTYTSQLLNDGEPYKAVALLQGKAAKGIEKDYSSKVFQYAASLNVVVTVSYGNNVSRKFGAVTDTSGVYRITIPAHDENFTFPSITIEGVPFTDSIKHYTSTDSVIMKGHYAAAQQTLTNVKPTYVSGVPYYFGDSYRLRFIFAPLDGENDGGTPYNWGTVNAFE